MADAKRETVNYRYDALNWDFIRLLAEIASFAGEKYGSPEQYTEARLTGEKSPVNHLMEHTRAYLNGEPHDHFKTQKHQLAAIAYNAMMEYFYLESEGPTAWNRFQKEGQIEAIQNGNFDPSKYLRRQAEGMRNIAITATNEPQTEPQPIESPRSKLLQLFKLS